MFGSIFRKVDLAFRGVELDLTCLIPLFWNYSTWS